MHVHAFSLVLLSPQSLLVRRKVAEGAAVEVLSHLMWQPLLRASQVGEGFEYGREVGAGDDNRAPAPASPCVRLH